MKKILLTVFIAVSSILLFSIGFDGNFSSLMRLAVYDSMRVSRQENSIGIVASGNISDNAKFTLRSSFSSLSDEIISGAEDLGSLLSFENAEMSIIEAEAAVFGIMGGAADLRMGRLRVNWGAGDAISPADILNPYDLRDKWTYEKRIGSDAVLLDLYTGPLQTSLFFTPFFRPNLLPGISASMLNGIPQSADFTADVELPGNTVSERFTAAIREKADIGGWSFAAQYAYTRDCMPWTSGVKISQGALPIFIYVNADLFYPRMHIASISARGSIKGAGVWMEGTFFVPEDNSYTIDMTGIGRESRDTSNIEGKWYAKAIAGADYIFENGYYLNVQYLHGFPGETGEENMNEYVAISLRMPLFDGKVELNPLDVSIGFQDKGAFERRFSAVFMPSISYKPASGVVISAKYLEFTGNEESILANVSDEEGAELSLKVYF